MHQFTFIIFTTLLILSGCQQSDETSDAPTKSVKIQEMETKSSGQTRVLFGVVRTENKADISFRVNGRIEKMMVDIGNEVQEGQILAKIEAKDFELNYLSAKATFESAKAELKEKGDEYKRYQKLKAQNYVSDTEIEKIKSHWMNAQSQAQVSQSRFEDAELNLQRTMLIAPFSGRISKRYFETFMEVKAGQPIFEIQGQKVLQVESLLPETLIHEVALGKEVQVTFPTLKDVRIKGKISQIDTDVQNGNAFLIKVSLSEAVNELRPGMTAVLTLDLFTEENPTYKLPLSAIDLKHSADKNQVSVYVFDAVNQVAKRKAIQIGEVVENQVEVLSGLTEGEQVITAGVPFLQEGQKVKRWQPSYKGNEGHM